MHFKSSVVETLSLKKTRGELRRKNTHETCYTQIETSKHTNQNPTHRPAPKKEHSKQSDTQNTPLRTVTRTEQQAILLLENLLAPPT